MMRKNTETTLPAFPRPFPVPCVPMNVPGVPVRNSVRVLFENAHGPAFPESFAVFPRL